MSLTSRPLFYAVTVSILAFGCATKTGSEGKIVATVNLGTGFDTAAITGLVLFLDAPGDAGLGWSAQAAATKSTGGRVYTSEVKDCDGDSRNEFYVTFAENPFAGGTFSFTFSGALSESVAMSLGVIVNMQNNKAERVAKDAFDDGTAIRFIAAQSKPVTVSIPCRVGYSCTAGTVTTLSLTTTDPASPSSGTTPKVKGTADSAWTVKLYSDAGCAALLATGTGSEFASPGIQVTVPANATTTLYA